MDAVLPPGWTKVGPDADGDYYYWNESTNETTWTPPAPMKVPPAPPPKPPKPPKPPRPLSPVPAPAATPQAPAVAPSTAVDAMRQMQQDQQSMLARQRADELREAQIASQRNLASTAERPQGSTYQFSKAAPIGESVDETIRLDSGIVEWDVGKQAVAEQRGRQARSNSSGIMPNLKGLVTSRGSSPPKTTRGASNASDTCSEGQSTGGAFNSFTSGFSVLSLAKSALACERGHQAGHYDPTKGESGNDAPRRRALNVLCSGEFDFNGKKLFLEGPLAKRNRHGNATYQFLLLEYELLYVEVVANKQRYHLHKVFPLTTCRAKAGDESGSTADPCIFSILNPNKSFVCAAPSPEVAKTWVESIERQARITCAAADAKYDDPNLTFAVIWRTNSDAKDCEQCSVGFTLLNRKHHCRNCGKVVCQACSMEKLRLEHISKDEFLRVCGVCYKEKKQSISYGVHRVIIADAAAAPAPKAEELAYKPVAASTANQPPTIPPKPNTNDKSGGGGASLSSSSAPPPVPPRSHISTPPAPAPTHTPAPPPPVHTPIPPPPVHTPAGHAPPPPPPAFFSLKNLQEGVPAGVDAANKELYLADGEFEGLFGCTKSEWQSKAAWQKAQRKKANNLF